MVPPEIIEYTPYSVALVTLWCAAMLTMAAKSLLSLKWKWKWKLLPCCFWSVLVLTTFLTPAEAVNANLQKDYTVLPGMKVWNGVPYHDFRRVWFAALIVALGSIFQEGWTLILLRFKTQVVKKLEHLGSRLSAPNSPCLCAVHPGVGIRSIF